MAHCTWQLLMVIPVCLPHRLYLWQVLIMSAHPLTKSPDLLKTVITALSTPPQNPPLLALLNAQNTAGNTPLHWAALNGHLASVQVLVDNGADPTITNKAGHDPVYEAELNDRKEVVEWVLKEGGGGLESGFGGNGEGEGEGEDMGMEDEQEGESSQQQNGQFDAELKKGLESMGFNEEKES